MAFTWPAQKENRGSPPKREFPAALEIGLDNDDARRKDDPPRASGPGVTPAPRMTPRACKSWANASISSAGCWTRPRARSQYLDATQTRPRPWPRNSTHWPSGGASRARASATGRSIRSSTPCTASSEMWAVRDRRFPRFRRRRTCRQRSRLENRPAAGRREDRPDGDQASRRWTR